MEFRRGILFIRLKGDLNKNTIKGVIDEDFKYVPDGNIIFPPSWDTEEKRNRVI